MKILEALQMHEIDLVILAGYMRLIGTHLLEAYASKIVNIHPSLLPAFPGKDAIGQALEAGVKVSRSNDSLCGCRYGYRSNHCARSSRGYR